MRLLSQILASAACLVLALGCSSSDDDGPLTDGNQDPRRAECETTGVFACYTKLGTCIEYYSDEGAEEARSSCQLLGDVPVEGPCGAGYSECCIQPYTSSSYPKAYCFTADDPDVQSLKDNCYQPEGEGTKWCGG